MKIIKKTIIIIEIIILLIQYQKQVYQDMN